MPLWNLLLVGETEKRVGSFIKLSSFRFYTPLYHDGAGTLQSFWAWPAAVLGSANRGHWREPAVVGQEDGNCCFPFASSLLPSMPLLWLCTLKATVDSRSSQWFQFAVSPHCKNQLHCTPHSGEGALLEVCPPQRGSAPSSEDGISAKGAPPPCL